MSNYLIALAIVGATSVPAAAQPAQTAQPAPAAQNAPAINQAQPQMVKKRICEDNDDPATTIHRICHTIMVPAQPNSSVSNKAPATNQGPNGAY